MKEKKCIVLEYLYDPENPMLPPEIRVCGKTKVVPGAPLSAAVYDSAEKAANTFANWLNNNATDPQIREKRAFRVDENGDDSLPFSHVIRLWDDEDYRMCAGYRAIAYSDEDIANETDDVYEALNSVLHDKMSGEQAEWERMLLEKPVKEILHSYCWEQTVRQDIIYMQENEGFDCNTCLRLLYVPAMLEGFTKYLQNCDHSAENKYLLGNMEGYAIWSKEGEKAFETDSF